MGSQKILIRTQFGLFCQNVWSKHRLSFVYFDLCIENLSHEGVRKWCPILVLNCRDSI